MCDYKRISLENKTNESMLVISQIENRSKKRKILDIEKLVKDNEFGYWMRTGNKSTNDGTGERYEEVFRKDEMKK